MPREIFDLDPDKLNYYLGVRNISQTELAKKSKVSRGSISLYCNGQQKPTVDTTHLLARALGVQFSDLARDGERADMGVMIEELEKLLKSCMPTTLRHSFPYLRELLKPVDTHRLDVMKFLMLEANSLGVAQLCCVRQDLKAFPQVYLNYSSKIHVYYVQSDEDDHEYEFLVKFESWVYHEFELEDDNQFISLTVEGAPGTNAWYADVIDQLSTGILCEEANNMKDYMADAFEELLDKADWVYPEELVLDGSPFKGFETELKTSRLQRLFDCMIKDGRGTEDLARAAADEEYAAQMFEEYGMGVFCEEPSGAKGNQRAEYKVVPADEGCPEESIL